MHEDQRIAYEAVADATDAELWAILKPVVRKSRTHEGDHLRVRQTISPNHIARHGLPKGVGKPRFNTGPKCGNAVVYHVPTNGSVTLEAVADAFRHSLRPQNAHTFEGP
jgi:hypothetical protein